VLAFRAAISLVAKAAPHALTSEFGSLVRACRKRARLTQAELADLSGLGVRTIRELELGRTMRPHRDTAGLLADALGIRGAAREAFERLATGKPPATLGGLPLPAQLPAGTPDFTGRVAEVAALRTLLTSGRSGPVVVTITGAPGIGKTALAIHVARQVRPSFADIQLFADLGASSSVPTATREILAGFLRAFGVDTGAIPEHWRERAALYRSFVAGSKVLVVLDDAIDEAHVRPLLPGGEGCATLVTSRAALACLEGSRVLRLLPPAHDEAVRLLAAFAGSRRVAAEPAAATAIVERCGHLPLALRAAGARLAARPHWLLGRLALLLLDETRRLDELAIGDLEVRATLDSSYKSLSESAQRALVLLASRGQSDVSAENAASLIDLPVLEAERVLDRLVDAWLLEVRQSGEAAELRYRLPELVRVYCRDLWSRQ
jgi:transcriptional regulator with XRE-family HTH domain